MSIYVGAILTVLLSVASVRSAEDFPENRGPFYFGDAWHEKTLVGPQIFVRVAYLPLGVCFGSGTLGRERELFVRKLGPE
jgi:hypothetical protein